MKKLTTLKSLVTNVKNEPFKNPDGTETTVADILETSLSLYRGKTSKEDGKVFKLLQLIVDKPEELVVDQNEHEILVAVLEQNPAGYTAVVRAQVMDKIESAETVDRHAVKA